MNLLTKILFLGILCVAAQISLAAPHSDMQDVSFSSKTGQIAGHGRYVVKYNVYYQHPNFTNSSPYTSSFLSSTISKTVRDYISFLREKGTIIIDCNKELRLDIYHITSSMINDHGRFSRWGPANNVSDKNTFHIWGLFDPIRTDKFNSALLITSRESRSNELLVAHEVSHYLYERFCLMMQHPGKTEQFAQEFQNYYGARN